MILVQIKKVRSLQVESTVPEGGVYGLQEDSRIIGLIYTAKMNKNKRLNSVPNVALKHCLVDQSGS